MLTIIKFNPFIDYMYHLLDEKDRMKALNEAMALLKNRGLIYVSFILMFAGMIFDMKSALEMLLSENERIFIDAVLKGNSYG